MEFYIVDTARKKKDPPSEKSSKHCQFGNCDEGSYVGACLAVEFGFDPKEIISCLSFKDEGHAWAMVPDGKGTYCVLDRHEEFKCGVPAKKIGEADPHGSASYKVEPGKTKFSYEEAQCFSFDDYVNFLYGNAISDK